MKISALLLLMFLTVTTTALALTPGAVQLRLLDCEMDYAAAIAMGAGPDNPKVKSLKAEIDAISAMPGVRDAKYWEYVKERRPILESDLARQTAEGKGPEDPKVQGTKAQLTALDLIEKNKEPAAAKTP